MLSPELKNFLKDHAVVFVNYAAITLILSAIEDTIISLPTVVLAIDQITNILLWHL